jgi:DnaK suppressor protein
VSSTTTAQQAMNTTAFAEFRTALAAREQQLQADIAAHRARLAEPAAATSNTFIAGDEGAVADADDELEVALLRRLQAELDDTQAALQRLQDGSYGRCLQCHAPVGLPRLRAVPEARLCMRCQRAADAGAAGRAGA